ncbi:integral membrane protein GPR137 [Ambystoma mexicanum]|uniref:integral membrane protein GPR137 n=1 Tax=Ambystoma mexicanum TaxID=8296 RepID=UPI0037E878F2
MDELSSSSNFSKMVPAESLQPAFPPVVKLGLTSLYTTLYLLLFLFVYTQLWLVLLYRHKKLSYQTVFLSLCLLWAALRATLFSFYFKNTIQANRLGPFLFWLLYCCPVCLQFFTLNLMNLYFAQVVFKSKARTQHGTSKGLLAVRLVCFLASLLFFSVNMVCAFLAKVRHSESWGIVLVRVLINDSLFMLSATSLACCLYLVARKSSSTSIYLEAKGTTVCRTAAVGGSLIVLSTSRACYNLVALILSRRTHIDSFDYDWYNVSDQADLISDLGDKGYLVFGLILFIWELLPTAILVGFFRVHQPPQDLSSARVINGQVIGSCSYFFDNTHQMDGYTVGSGMASSVEQPNREEACSLSASLQKVPWYGSMGRRSNNSWFTQNCTPPLLFSRDHEQGNHHHSLYSTPQT